MSDKTRPYDYLKRDVPMTVANLAGLAAALMPVLSTTYILVPHGYLASHGNPLYWLIMLPVLYWGLGVTSFDPWAIRLLAPVLIIAPVTDILIAKFSGLSGSDLTGMWVLAALSVMFAIVGTIALSRTPLWPFRRR
ncbi:hypothetical protein [Polymorphobacter megasporae]|uniref:hypothetical protein n=1 Tax=Glacieibacterium megasporae TaxID=2835787 RepID=UPI001C1E6206|nr:hypothetical protein [Polymorphobacter megasporae]UAJ08643.1 hypothetical protein KTC28_09520 [Polymorphobacter megasporae]